MMKFYITLLLLLGISSTYAQEAAKQIQEQNVTYVADQLKKIDTKKDSASWSKAGTIGIKFTQVSLVNWAAGGENAMAMEVQTKYHADYTKNKTLWQNRIELAFGLNKSASQGVRKTSDKIYLNSNYGYKIKERLYASVFFEYLSQFATGYDYKPTPAKLLSRFMAPGYMSEGLGLTWVANSHLNLVFTPATARQVFVLDKALSDQGAFGVKKGKSVRNEFGATFKIEANYDIMKNVNVFSRLKLFTDYLDSPFSVVDVNWEVQVNMTINKWLSANVNTNLLYNHYARTLNPDGTSSAAKVQFKESLGIGLQCNF